jgi:hypothetical protein
LEKRELVAAVVGGRAGAGAADVFRLTLTLRTFSFAATAAVTFATSGSLSLARQRQTLQLAQVHAGQADSRLQIFTMFRGGLSVPGGR